MATYLMYDNTVDYAATVITAGSANADLPVSNLAHPQRKRVYRTGVSAAAEWVKFDLGTAVAVQAVVLLDHTLTSGDSAIKLQGNATDVWTAPSVDETLTFASGTITKILSSAQTYRWWRVIFTKSAAAEYRDIGRVFLGPVTTMTRKFRYGSLDIDPVDLSETEYSLAGQSYSIIRDSFDEINGEFFYITDAQMQSIEAMCAYVGTHTPLFISIDSTNMPTRWLYYGKLTSLGKKKVEHLGSGSYYWSVPFKMREEL